MFFVDDSQNVVIVQGLLLVTERLHLLCLHSFPTHFWRSCLHALTLKCSNILEFQTLQEHVFKHRQWNRDFATSEVISSMVRSFMEFLSCRLLVYRPQIEQLVDLHGTSAGSAPALPRGARRPALSTFTNYQGCGWVENIIVFLTKYWPNFGKNAEAFCKLYMHLDLSNVVNIWPAFFNIRPTVADIWPTYGKYLSNIWPTFGQRVAKI